jgi:hypothetical protein
LSNFEISNIITVEKSWFGLTAFSECNKLSKIKIKKSTYEAMKNMIPNKTEIIIV